jgi:hypothetical protein
MQICHAATVTWALVFSPTAGNWDLCFAERAVCEMAALGANTAFAVDGGGNAHASCEAQPADLLATDLPPLLPYIITIERPKR